MAKERRTETMQFRFTPSEKAELKRRADAADLKPSDYVRSQCCGDPTEAPDPATRLAAKAEQGQEERSPQQRKQRRSEPPFRQHMDRDTDTDPDRIAQFDRIFNQLRRRMGPSVARVTARKEVYGW